MQDYKRFMQQIAKAAKLIDLREDFSGAIQVLQTTINDAEIDNCIFIKLEAFVFLAEIYQALNDIAEVKKYISLAEELDLSSEEPDMIAANLAALQDIKHRLEM